MKKWPRVPLELVLRHRKEFVTIDDIRTYMRCRVQLHAKGVVIRDRAKGAEIRTKKQQLCRAGDFLVAEIDAKMGGFGLVPPELNGAIVSSHYFLFEVDESKLDGRYLDYFCRTDDFRGQVNAQGTTNYAAIRPRDVLSYEVPLPPLAEQQAIVARLDTLSDKARHLTAHLNAIEADSDALVRSYLFGDRARSYARQKMSDFVELQAPNVVVDHMQRYQFAGVYSFGRGVFASVNKEGSNFAYERLSTVRAGDFIYPKLMAWEGALGVVPTECDGMVVSPEFPVFKIDMACMLPEILDIYFRTPSVWPELASLSGGTNVRRRRLQPSAFLSYKMPVPPMPTQEKIRELSRATQALKSRHAAIRETNSALLPAILERLFSQVA